MIAIIFTLLGLICDIAGAVILFNFGLLGDLTSAILSSPDITKTPEQIKKYKKNTLKSKSGLYLLIIGFVFQFIGSVIQILSLVPTGI